MTIALEPLPLKQTSFKQATQFLSNLLPYDPRSKAEDRVLDGLNEYLLLLIASEKAFVAAMNDEFEKFDPLVGENACQIRALKLACLSIFLPFNFAHIINKIREIILKTQKLLKDPNKIVGSKISLQELINAEDLNIPFTQDQIFLVNSYILTTTKVQNPNKTINPIFKNVKTDSKQIKQFLPVGRIYADNLIRKLREKLSEQSTMFVQNIAQAVPSSEITRMASKKYVFDHKGLSCLPYFWTTQIILQESLQLRIPMIFLLELKAKDNDYAVVEKTSICFMASQEGYKITSQDKIDPNAPVLIFLGTTCRNVSELPNKKAWEEEILKYSPFDLLLAYAAAHRQYPDESKEALFEDIQEKSYVYYKAKSKEWGCSAENPYLFFLSHAYCDKMKNITDQFKP